MNGQNIKNLAECAGGIVFRLDDKEEIEILLVRSSHESDQKWGIPKGHLEEGETLEECAVREIFEECGVEAKLLMELAPVFSFNGAENKILNSWICTQECDASPQPMADDIKKCGWFSIKKLPKIHNYQIEQIDSAIKIIKKNMV